MAGWSVRIGGAMFVAMVLLALVGPALPESSPFAQDLSRRTRPPLSVNAAGELHLLGTDALGRDLLSRLALGGRVSIMIAAVAVLVSATLGTALGLVAGYAGGVWENGVMAVADMQLSIPRVLLLIGVVAVVGPSIVNLAIVLGATSWVGYARVARAQTLSLKERDFVTAARALGASQTRLLLRHVLPNALGPVLILAGYDAGQMILLEASMSFLGLGVQPPMPSWGSMINEGQTYMRTFPLLVLLPGCAILLTVGGLNFLTQAFTAESQPARTRVEP